MHPMSDAQSPIVRFGVGLGACMCLFGAPVSGYFLGQIFLAAQASATWPSVPGTLTTATVRDNGFGRYSADVSYNFRVDDATFVGTKIRASDGEYNQRDGAEQAIRGLIVGQQVRVFYNPTKPQQAVLRTGTGFVEYALLLVPVLMFAYGIWALRQLWRSRLCD